MRAGFTYVVVLIVSFAVSGTASAGEAALKKAALLSPTTQAATGEAPGTANLRRDLELLSRDFEHLKEINQERIKASEDLIAVAGDRLSNAITLLIAFIIAAGFTGYFSARKQATEAVDRWIKREGEKILKGKIDEAQVKIHEMTKEAEREFREFVDSARENKAKIEDMVNGVSSSLTKG